MVALNELHHSEQVKTFLSESFKEVIAEIQRRQAEVMEFYKNNPTFPFDFYNLSIIEGNTKISCIREPYRRITKEELE